MDIISLDITALRSQKTNLYFLRIFKGRFHFSNYRLNIQYIVSISAVTRDQRVVIVSIEYLNRSWPQCLHFPEVKAPLLRQSIRISNEFWFELITKHVLINKSKCPKNVVNHGDRHFKGIYSFRLLSFRLQSETFAFEMLMKDTNIHLIETRRLHQFCGLVLFWSNVSI